MIKVAVYTDENQKINEVFVSGHAKYDIKGKDIVCSAVSTAVMLSGNLITKFCPKYLLDSNEEKGEIRIKLLEANEASYIIMDNLVECLKDISSSYQKYLKIKIMK